MSDETGFEEAYDGGDDDPTVDVDEVIDPIEDQDEEEEEDENESEEDSDVEECDDPEQPDDDLSDMAKLVRGKQTTLPRLTKFEQTAIIGYRAQQLAEGAPPYIVVENHKDAIGIALQEYAEGKIPLMVERPIPACKVGVFTYETYRLNELIDILPSK
jgi:DNA-directed RNA polymerase subunit K/omega